VAIALEAGLLFANCETIADASSRWMEATGSAVDGASFRRVVRVLGEVRGESLTTLRYVDSPLGCYRTVVGSARWVPRHQLPQQASPVVTGGVDADMCVARHLAWNASPSPSAALESRRCDPRKR
jgi:hypothetical protein